MKYENRRYVVGVFVILLQFFMIESYTILLGTEKRMSEVCFLIFIFFYFKEDIYSFKSYLVWKELKKHIKVLI
ncbi:MAG: hypothetical protein ACRC6U_07505, partial [Fusobacteriaceae bacterium]